MSSSNAEIRNMEPGTKVVKHPFLEWRNLDADSGMLMPWYTAPMLEWLKSKDVSKWTVFEYGCGMSTLWWRFNAKWVDSVDISLEWAQNISAYWEDDRYRYIDYPYRIPQYKDGQKYDVVVIDGHWRDECTKVAIACLKPGGYLIIDNYHQQSCDLPASEWTRTDELLKNYPVVIFPQEGHPDWKTGLWQII